MSLPQRLRSELDDHGFCYDTLRGMQKICGEELTEMGGGLTPADYVATYLIQDVCLATANRLDAIAPVTTEMHAKIEQALLDPLKDAIAVLGSSAGCEEKILALATLLKARG